MGRQKLEMKKISNENHLLVSFSKRRAGLFKKASELCCLCSGEIAIIVFAPGKKRVYSFGHRNVKHVIDKYTGENPNPAADSGVLQGPAEPRLGQLMQQATELDDQLETQRALGEWLADERKKREAVDWFRAPVNDLPPEQLQTLISRFEGLMSSVDRAKNLAETAPDQNLTSSDQVGGEAYDGSGHSLGIVMTPEGYAMC
ncbi:agamous-like MADS-box protein AGL62 [Apium graveolens]|uniref:agamous-like MADS-box protein AGL62 n=1 Tax=Apium graveolens TaxID=4045 RepID=UPI003D7B4F84